EPRVKSFGKRNGLRCEEMPQSLHRCPTEVRLRQRSKRTEQITIRNTAGTSRLASEAAETLVDMRLRLLPREISFENFLHQHDAPARCVHLFAQFAIRRTSGEAKAAMHTRLHRISHRLAERAVFVSGD